MKSLIKIVISIVLGAVIALITVMVLMYGANKPMGEIHYTADKLFIGRSALLLLFISPIWAYFLKRKINPERTIPWSAWVCLAVVILVFLVIYSNS